MNSPQRNGAFCPAFGGELVTLGNVLMTVFHFNLIPERETKKEEKILA